MNFYWPSGMITEGGKTKLVSEPYACTSLESAKEVIKIWRDNMDLAISWIEDRGEDNKDTGKIACLEVYNDAFGDKIPGR